MKRARLVWAAVAAVLGAGPAVSVAQEVVFSQPPSPAGGLIQSSWMDPDGSDWDWFIWDNFTLSGAATITEVRWRGGYAYGGSFGGPVVNFTVAFYPSIAAGTEPDVVHPPLVEYETGGNCGQSPAGTFGGTAMYDYRFTLPQAFQAAGGTKYWLQIYAWHHGIPEWGFNKATTLGSHFRRQSEYMFQFAPGDAAFTLLGQVECTGPSVTASPAPVTICPGRDASFAAAGTGTGPLDYRWRKDGSPLSDGPTSWGSTVAGAFTGVLTITAAMSGDAGEYDCEITNGCGSATTAGAALHVCAVDFNCDGLVDFGDYLEFLNLYDHADTRADLNGDGLVDFSDYLEFLNWYETGC